MTEIIRATGCLPRRTAPGWLFPRFSERKDVVPESQWNYTDFMRRQIPTEFIRDQGAIGSCAAEAATAAIMLCRKIAGLPDVMLQPYSLYHYSSGGWDRGSSLDSNLEYARLHGVVPDELWPRGRGFRPPPTQEMKIAALPFRALEAFDVRTRPEFGTAISKGFCVEYGRPWGMGAHAILAVQLTKDGVIHQNSHGRGYGDGGFGEDPWYKIEPHIEAYGAWALRTVTQEEP